MNILLSMPSDNQSNHYIINALQDMGHSVFYVDHRAYLEDCKKSIEPIFNIEKIDMMLVLYLEPGKTYDIDFIRTMKARFPNVIYISWIFDATLQNKYCNENEELIKIVKEYDYFFTVCRGQVESFKNQGVNAYFLQEGASPYTYKFSLKKLYDVSFIGQVGHSYIHQERLPLLKEIIARYDNTVIFGSFYTDDEDIISHHSKRPTYNDVEHSKIVAQTKINIGHSGWPYIDGYFSARNYRIMISGGFLLANRSKNVEEFFTEDKEIVFYNNTAECLDKIKYYLKNDNLREKIARNGYQRVTQSYRFNDSFKKMFEIIK